MNDDVILPGSLMLSGSIKEELVVLVNVDAMLFTTLSFDLLVSSVWAV